MAGVSAWSQSVTSRGTFGADQSTAGRAHSSCFAFKNVMIPMRNGVRLATDVYVPSNDGVTPAPGHFPVLLLRTRYGKENSSTRPAESRPASVGKLYPDTANKHGYAIVYQDARGTFNSEGTFEPMLNEGKDEFDTVEWLRQQPWSDGRVATFGPSYMGGVQLLLAAELRGAIAGYRKGLHGGVPDYVPRFCASLACRAPDHSSVARTKVDQHAILTRRARSAWPASTISSSALPHRFCYRTHVVASRSGLPG